MLAGFVKARELAAGLFLAAELLRNVSFLLSGVTVNVSHVRAKPPRHQCRLPVPERRCSLIVVFLIPRERDFNQGLFLNNLFLFSQLFPRTG